MGCQVIDIAVYIRDDQNKSKEETLEEQREACRKKAEECGYKIIESA